MKRIISLIISASIIMQMMIPAASLVTYAQTRQGAHGYERVAAKRLDEGLDIKDSLDSSTEALVSWKAESETSPYILEYFIENMEGTATEKIRFTFKKDTSKNATATIEVRGLNDDPILKDYRIFDFDKIDSGEVWKEKNTESIEVPIAEGTRFPGGRVRIGDIELRFRWKDGNVHFQTDQVKHGYITPFSLRYGITGTPEKIDVLTGIDGYKVSPIHIETDGTPTSVIKNKEVIIVPGSDEVPGSKPGVRVDFKRPKQWSNTENEFKFLDDAKNIVATLELEDLTDVAKARLVFNMAKDESITGLGDGKKLAYNSSTKTYSLYLAKDDEGHDNILKWEKLEKSMILKKAELSLIRTNPGQALGIFSTRPETSANHTYLGYTIKRSSMDEAFMEIQPYNGAKNTEYTYVVESAPNMVNGVATWVELAEHKYTATGESTEKSFTIPVPFSSSYDDKYYRVRAKYNQIVMSSQILHYQPKEDLTVPPPTPVIQSVDNIYVVPPEKTGGAPATIGFDLTWSAPKNTSQNKLLDTLLEKGDIYYELFFHEDLESTEGKDKGVLNKVFKVGLDKDKKISVEPYAGTAGSELAGIRYNPSKDTFTMENIVLKNLEQENWEQVNIKNPNYKGGNDYPVNTDANPDEITATNDMPPREVPGIYYVTMRAIYDTSGSAITMGLSNTSNPKSVTISPLEEVIPVPTKIESKPLPDENDSDIIRQSFSWGNVNLDRYIKQMLDPLNIVVGGDGKGVYEVYLYQKKNLEESDFKDIEPTLENLHSEKGYKLDEDDIKKLRDGGVIRLDYKGTTNTGMNTITLDGLDANQVYYTKIRVRLDIKDKDDQDFEETRYSVFSKEHSFTSYTKPSEPGPGERVPPVPEKLQLIDQPNNTTAKIGWEAPEYTIQVGENLYYEMIRIDSRTLAKEEDSRLFTIKKLLGDDKKDEIAGWRTKEILVEQYEKVTDKWSKAIPEQESSKLQLEDSGLNPNKIYYYYVRTVLVIDGEEVYSSWVGIPVTTDPIQKPIQLKVEDKETYSHDPKKEIVISFLAPIPKGADIPRDYDFDVAVQGELDDDYKLDYSKTRLTSKMEDKDIPTGYSHYVYRITNLKPGKRYDIKVRVIDKIVGMVNNEYPKSLYSDRVTTRTQFDQDEQDKDDKFEEYLKYFEDKVEALRRKPYWTLEDGSSTFSIKYRNNYIVPEINSTKTYKLDVKEGASHFTYYMPANTIISANLNQTSFEIKQGDVIYSVRPSTITTELTEIKRAVEDINEKYIRDYYIAFNFRQRKSSTRADFLTPEISVDIELVRLKDEDLFIEDDIMVALNEQIDREKVRFINDLERALERGKILDEDLDVLIDKSLESIMRVHQRDVRSIISRATHRTLSIGEWNKSMMIMAAIKGNAVAQGYLLGWQDTPITTFNTGQGYGIEVNQAGTYGFKGHKVDIPTIPGAGGAGDLVAKYQLTEFFGVDGKITPSQTVTKRSVLGAMARVLGAPKGADYVQYLKQMGIKGINNIGMDLPLKNGEGIYLLMQVYEKVHKKPITSIHIKNRNAVSNLKQFNQLHQPYVLAAVDSKIVSPGIAATPNGYMQIKDVLQVLTNIMSTVR